MLKKFTKKNANTTNLVPKSFATNPIATHKAVELFAKQTDIKKFTDLVLQENISEEFLNNTQAELLLKDVFNPFSDESYKKLAQNEKLLKDLAADTD